MLLPYLPLGLANFFLILSFAMIAFTVFFGVLMGALMTCYDENLTKLFVAFFPALVLFAFMPAYATVFILLEYFLGLNIGYFRLRSSG